MDGIPATAALAFLPPAFQPGGRGRVADTPPFALAGAAAAGPSGARDAAPAGLPSRPRESAPTAATSRDHRAGSATAPRENAALARSERLDSPGRNDAAPDAARRRAGDATRPTTGSAATGAGRGAGAAAEAGDRAEAADELAGASGPAAAAAVPDGSASPADGKTLPPWFAWLAAPAVGPRPAPVTQPPATGQPESGAARQALRLDPPACELPAGPPTASGGHDLPEPLPASLVGPAADDAGSTAVAPPVQTPTGAAAGAGPTATIAAQPPAADLAASADLQALLARAGASPIAAEPASTATARPVAVTQGDAPATPTAPAAGVVATTPAVSRSAPGAAQDGDSGLPAARIDFAAASDAASASTTDLRGLAATLPVPAAPAARPNAIVNLHAPVGTPQWQQGLGEQVQWLADRDFTQAQIKLNPAQLGPIEVKVQVNGDQATISFTTHSHATRDALEQAAPRLREMLGASGFASVDVNVAQHSFSERPQQQHASAHYGSLEDWRPADAPAVAALTSRAPRSRLDAYA